jgi:hypothetical protein
LKNISYIINLTVKINYKCLYILHKKKLELHVEVKVKGEENLLEVHKGEDNELTGMSSSPHITSYFVIHIASPVWHSDLSSQW